MLLTLLYFFISPR